MNTTRPRSTPQPTHVAVVGGGIAGGAAALLLARQGLAVTVLERSARGAPAGAGILLQPNGLAVLYGLGLRDALRRRAHVLHDGEVRTGTGRILSATPVPDFGSGLDHALALRRSDLMTALDNAVRVQPGITVIDGARVTGVAADGHVDFQSGSGPSSLRADLVIGADGLHSAVRMAGAFGAHRSSTGSVYARGLVEGVVADGALVGEAWTALGLFGSSPVGGATYFYASVTHPAVVAALRAGDRDAFVARWSHELPAAAPILDRLPDLNALLVNDVDTVHTPTFVDGRLVLIGDAAHAMEPTLGQGANSALLDAATLAGELAHRDRSSALEAYDRNRRPAVQKVQRDADRIARLSRSHSVVGRWVRDHLVRLASRPAAGERRYRAAQQADPAEVLASVAALASAPVARAG